MAETEEIDRKISVIESCELEYDLTGQLKKPKCFPPSYYRRLYFSGPNAILGIGSMRRENGTVCNQSVIDKPVLDSGNAAARYCLAAQRIL
ncbi:hypothetical protein [Methanothrix sp.]|uniref:hypothetical protein n=1 Tax=Methanothrix sp. TaxID=90426 RepID=UPI0032997F1A